MDKILHSSPPNRAAARLLLWVGLFGSFTYLLLSAWAQIAFGDRYVWMSEIRLISIAAGTLLYALVLRAAMRSRMKAGGPAMLALYVAGASLIMLVLRYAIDRLLSDPPLGIGEHIVWVLIWAGYFGLWVSAFLEMEWRKTAVRRTAKSPVMARTAGTSAGAIAQAYPLEQPYPLDADEAEAWSWIVDALADEMSRHPEEARAALLSHLQRRAGYALADDAAGIDAAHNRRVTLVESLARRTRAAGAPPTRH